MKSNDDKTNTGQKRKGKINETVKKSFIYKIDYVKKTSKIRKSDKNEIHTI